MKKIVCLVMSFMVFTSLVSFAHAESVPINWRSNSTSDSGNICDDSACPSTPGNENLRLGNANHGWIEGTVILPSYGNWDMNFSVKTDGNYQSTNEYVKIYIDSILIDEINNYPTNTIYPVFYSFEGDAFNYRLEFYSPAYPHHSHLIVQNGTVSSSVETFSCVGFESPMDKGPVTAKKNRALPLKVQLYRTDGSPVTGMGVTEPPAIQIYYDAGMGEEPIDVTEDALSTGRGTEGNQLVYTEEGKWQFNLKINNYTSTGTYSILVVTSNPSEYLIDSGCYASFIIE